MKSVDVKAGRKSFLTSFAGVVVVLLFGDSSIYFVN